MRRTLDQRALVPLIVVARAAVPGLSRALRSRGSDDESIGVLIGTPEFGGP